MAKDVALRTDADDADLVWACTRKVAYPTNEIARSAASRVRARNPSSDVWAYACRRCGQYHIGGHAGAFRVIAADIDLTEQARRERRRRPRRRHQLD